MHATIPKGFVGGIEFTVFQRNLNHARETMEVCLRVLKKSNKSRSDSYSVKKTVYWLYPILPFGIVACTFFSDDLSRNRCIQEFQVVCTCMIFNHILIFTIKSNIFKKAIRRGYFYPGYHSFFSRVRRLSAEMFRDRLQVDYISSAEGRSHERVTLKTWPKSKPVQEKTLAPSRAFPALF